MEFLRSSKILSLLTLSSRILGLIRDMVTTALLPDRLSDALYYAWTVPNLFRNLFGEGALSSAFIPVFAKEVDQSGREKAFRLARDVITFIGIFLFALVAILVGLTYVLPESILMLPFGENVDKMYRALGLLRVLLPYLAIACVIAQCQGVLNTLKVFFIPALSPILLNTFWILAALLAGFVVYAGRPEQQALFIAFGIMAGGLVQILLFVLAFKRHQFPVKPSFNFRNESFRKVLATTIPMVLGASAVQLNILVDRSVAEAMIPGDGGVTHLFVGNRLMQFPFAMIGVALTTAAFPLMARLIAAGDLRGMKENLAGALRINFFLSIPAAVGLSMLAHPIITLFFQRNEFTMDQVDPTVSALLGYAAGIPFLCSSMLLTRAFYAQGEWRRPVAISACLVVVNIILDVILVRVFAEGGVAAATSICAILQSAALFYFLRRKLGPIGGKAVLRGMLGTIAMTLLLIAAVEGGLWIAGTESGEDPLWPRTVRVFLPLVLGLLAFLIPARWICSFEWIQMKEALSRKKPGGD